MWHLTSLPLPTEGADEKGTVCQHDTVPEDESGSVYLHAQNHSQLEVCLEGAGPSALWGGA